MDLKIAIEQRDRVEEFRRRHRIGLLTLLFTDMVGSTQLKQTLGDAAAFARIQEHHSAVREILAGFPEGEEIGTAGDSFFIVFAKPSEAVKFSLLMQSHLRELSANAATPVLDRIGIHIGEVIIEERPGAVKSKDLYGIQVDVCARVMSLGDGDQILMTRSAFDNARQVLKGQELAQLGPLTWESYGPYLLQGVEEPLEVCEVGEMGLARLAPPVDSAKARRAESVRDGSSRLPRGAEKARPSRRWLGAAVAAAAIAAVGFVIYFRPASIPAQPPGATLVRIGFEADEGYLVGESLIGRQGWTRGKWPDQLPDGGQGVIKNLIPGSPQHAFIGGVSGATKPTVHAAATRAVQFTPAESGDSAVTMSWRQIVTDSTKGPRNNFEWLFYNQSGNLLGGLSFNNGTRKIMRRRPDNRQVETGMTFDRNRVYDVKLRLDFRAREWTATIGDTVLEPQPMMDRDHKVNLGGITLTWWSTAVLASDPGATVAGDNLIAFDDFEVKALEGSPKHAKPSH